MQILALENEVPGVDADRFTAGLLRAEAAQVYELQQTNIIRAIYFRADQTNAVLMLECPDLDAAREALDSLPLVQAGLITFELIPLRPYTGFSRLFNTSNNA